MVKFTVAAVAAAFCVSASPIDDAQLLAMNSCSKTGSTCDVNCDCDEKADHSCTPGCVNSTCTGEQSDASDQIKLYKSTQVPE